MSSTALSVLVIDDSRSVLSLVKNILEQRGHGVRLAQGAMEGLAAMEQASPDLVLLDVEMPDMDGFQLCAIIRTREVWKGIPVVFLSGRGGEEAIVQGFGAGGNDYVVKPFNERELIARVEAHGGKALMERALATLAARQEELIAERTRDLDASRAELLDTLALLARERSLQDQLVNSKKLASLGKLVADLAHQVNTPLGNSITMASYGKHRLQEFLEPRNAPANLDPRLQSFLQELSGGLDLMSHNLERIHNLVERFRNLIQEDDSSQVRMLVFQSLVDVLQSRLDDLARERSIRLIDQGQAGLAFLTRPDVLTQILQNLLDNAIEHAFPGRDGQIEIKAWREGKVIHIHLGDNGRGMDASVASHIYEPFVSTRRHGGAHGLGLFLVHNLVQGKLGGTIECSTSPAGTSFLLTFEESIQ